MLRVNHYPCANSAWCGNQSIQMEFATILLSTPNSNGLSRFFKSMKFWFFGQIHVRSAHLRNSGGFVVPQEGPRAQGGLRRLSRQLRPCQICGQHDSCNEVGRSLHILHGFCRVLYMAQYYFFGCHRKLRHCCQPGKRPPIPGLLSLQSRSWNRCRLVT